MIDTIHGAKSSAIIYSIVETAKANNLKPFDYVQHLLEEIPKHMNDKGCSFLEDLLTRAEDLPVIIPGLSAPPVRTLRAIIPENESHIFR